LIEVLAVITILTVIAVIFVPKIRALMDSAKSTAIHYSLSELNTREKLIWTDLKLETNSDIDAQVYSKMDYYLGDEWSWVGKTSLGGTLLFKNRIITLVREPSTNTQPATWTQF